MSSRSFADGRKLIGKKKSAQSQLDSAVLAGMEHLEQRQLLNAAVVTPTLGVTPSGANPLPPMPGVTFYANAQSSSNAWQWSSAVTPNTVNDLILNVTAYNQSYTGCCEGTNAAPGNTGSINGGRLLTNGITQNQIGGFPVGGAIAAQGSGSNSDASSGASVVSQVGSQYWFEYNLGAQPGNTPSSTGYDISEIDMISGHQDYRVGIQADVLVQYAGQTSTNWYSLSNGNNFSYTGLGRGSAQVAVIDPNGSMAKNVSAVKFFVANQNTWYRELVVTGTPSTTSITQAPNAPGTPTVAFDASNPSALDVTFTAPVGYNSGPGAVQDYLVQRAVVTNGVPGAFATVQGIVSTNSTTTFVDTTSAAGTQYVYRIIAENTAGSSTSGVSTPFTTSLVNAELHLYNMAYWEGPATVNQGITIVQENWPSAPAPGIRQSQVSSAITGKVTTNQGGVYTFYSNTDDDGYLYVNGILVSSDPGGHGQRNAGSQLDINFQPLGFATPIQLAANTSYDFVLLQHNSGGGAGSNLVWTTPSMSPGTSQIVPAANLSPVSDTPHAPTNLTVLQSNSNFVNFTFSTDNNAVVHYILQRAIAGTTNWVTVDMIDPGSAIANKSGGVIQSASNATLTIQDAEPIPGNSYIYRVAALNFDGAAASPSASATLGTTPDLTSPPAGSATLGTATDASGLAAGTYYVAYTWLNSAGGETAASAEQTITTTGVGDVTVALPAAPSGAVNANVYLSSVSGQERLVGTAAGGQTVTVKGLPITSAVAAPSNDTAGLATGTYYVAYTWVGNNSSMTGESSSTSVSNSTHLYINDETFITVGSVSDLTVSGFQAAPAGVGSVNVYVGTSSGSERLVGSTSPTGSLTISALPSTAAAPLPFSLVNNTANVSSVTGTIGIPAVPGNSAPNSQGVEIHMYNQELFRRTSLSQLNEASSLPIFGMPAEYRAQTSVQTLTPGVLAGPIDDDYTGVVPSIIPTAPPTSPDPTLFPDINRIHTESYSQAFTGALTPSVSGVYTIISNTDDDGYVWLNGTLISSDPGGHGQRNATANTPVFLSVGQTYNLTMFMGNTGGGAGAHLRWIEPSPAGNNATGTVNPNGTSNTGQAGATISLAGNGSITQSNYNNYTVFITSGPGAGQAGLITAWNNTTKVATINVTTNGNALLWSTVPTSASGFMIAWVAPVPVKGGEGYFPNGTQGQGGLSLYQAIPTAGTWNLTNGSVSVTTSASAAQNVTISQISSAGGVTLSWSDSGLSELWFEVQRSTDGATWSTIGTTAMNVGTTFTDTTAGNAFRSPTTSYFYRVRGVNFDGAGPFSPAVNTNTGVQIAAPNIVNIIQGAPGTAGLVLSGGSNIAGGLDIQYAPVTGGTTGAFVDATPVALPFNTFDYQVTGLTATQQYVFKVRNMPSANNTNSSLFGNVVAFTPSGGIQEAFGTPGAGTTYNGSFTSAGDLQVNTNAALTGSGVPSPATPSSAPNVTTPNDIGHPLLFPTLTVNADAPAPTTSGTFTTNPNNLGLSNVSTVFLEYTWVTANGETLPFSGPQQSFTVSPGTGVNLTYTVPTAPSGFGIVNANVYMGTSTTAGAESRKATIAPGTSVFISSLPANGSPTVPTVSTAGIPAGTYFIQYNWVNSAGQQSKATSETSVVATNSANDITVTIPTAPAGVSSANVYVGTVSGGEHLIGSTNPGGSLSVRGLPSSTAATPPTTDSQGLAAGTYYVQYTWQGTEPNENTTNEGLTSPITTVTVAANQDLSVSIPTSPGAGNGNANIYIGSSPTTLYIAGQAAPNSLFLAHSAPTSGNTAPIPGTVTTGPLTVTQTADAVVSPPTGTLTINGTQPDGASVIGDGTYYLQYTWQGSGGGETTGSVEQTVTVSGSGGHADIVFQVPTTPTGAGSANIYIGTTSGGEQLVTSASGGAQVTLKSLPATNAPAVPTTNTVGLNAGTYYLAYTWQSGNGLETAGSTEQTIVVTANGTDLNVVPPAGPVGAGNARIYLGSAPGQEFIVNPVAPGSTLTIRSLPNINNKIVPLVNSQQVRLFTPSNALQVTNNNGGQAGNAFNLGENIAGFTTSFDFELTGNTSADGIGFVIQPDGRVVSGGSGGAMSYSGTTPSMQHSVGVFFDTYDGHGTGRTGLGVNGSMPGSGGLTSSWQDMSTQNSVPTGVAITNGVQTRQRPGDVFNVTLAYNNTTHILTENVYDVTLKNRGVNNGFSTSYSIDIVATVGMPAAYVGFTGGTGGAQAEHDILDWTFTNSTVTPSDIINGTAGVDNITLTQDADHQHIDFTVSGDTHTYQMSINDVAGLTINGNGSNDQIFLNYANGNPLPNLINLNGRFTINNLQGTNPLAGTTVDVGTSTVFIPYGSPATDPLSLIQGYLKNGYNGNTWTGLATASTGSIRSSAAALNPNNVSVGYADSADTGNPAAIPTANTIEIRYAGLGDSNLNNTVDIGDYNAVVRNFGTGTMWDQGDTTYDATVSINDYNAVVRHFGAVVTSQSATPAAAPALTTATTTSSSSSTTSSSSKTANSATSGLATLPSSVTLNSSSSSSTTSADSSSGSSLVDSTGKKHKNSSSKKHK